MSSKRSSDVKEKLETLGLVEGEEYRLRFPAAGPKWN
jgi:hypothetical protein